MSERIQEVPPCMYDSSKPCVNCRNNGINRDNLNRLAKHSGVKNIMNHEGIDTPTEEQLSDLLYGLKDPLATIYYDSVESRAFISPELRKLGVTIAKKRKDWIVQASGVLGYDIYCPVLGGELKKAI